MHTVRTVHTVHIPYTHSTLEPELTSPVFPSIQHNPYARKRGALPDAAPNLPSQISVVCALSGLKKGDAPAKGFSREQREAGEELGNNQRRGEGNVVCRIC